VAAEGRGGITDDEEKGTKKGAYAHIMDEQSVLKYVENS
jgi:hypothetical protein